MDRDLALRQMSSELFDLIVIGGGITGCGIAREAALRGLKVALVERHDFAYGTSSRSTKLIHGGLRYLKQFDFKLVRESVQERQVLIQMAPHLVKVRKFLFPVYKGDPDRLFKLRIGLKLYDWFAGSSNQIPHQILGPGLLQRMEPTVRATDLTGGGLYNDCATNDSRLTLAVLQSAVAYGARAANYCAVTGYVYDDTSRISGVTVCDELSGQTHEIVGKRVLSAAGPWADHLRYLDDPTVPDLLRTTKGVHITVPHERLPLSNAVVMRGPDQRMMFAIPSGDFTYLGTTDTDHDGKVESAVAERADVAYILAASNHAFPECRLTPDDVISTWVGLRPLIKPTLDKSPSAVSRDYALYHSKSGLITVAGGKLTAFRAMASHIIDEIIPTSEGLHHLSLSMAVLPGAEGPSASSAEIGALAISTHAQRVVVARLADEYGSHFALMAEELCPGDPADLAWLLAQTRHAVKREMAQRLEDVISRRTGALLFSWDNGSAHLEALAAEMAGMLGWSPQRRADEIRRCLDLIRAMFTWREERSPGPFGPVGGRG